MEERQPKKPMDLDGVVGKSVLAHPSLLVGVLDEDGKVVRLGAACERLTGMTTAGVQGRTWSDALVPPDQAAKVRTRIRRSIDSERPRNLDFDLLTSRGRRAAHWQCTVVKDGGLKFCLLVGEDASGRKRHRRQLAAARQAAAAATEARAQFFAHVNHEVRTPLNAVIGFADILADERMGPVGKPVYAEYARIIANTSRDVLRLFADILDISQMELDVLELVEEDVEVCAFLGVCRMLAAPLASRHEVRFSCASDCRTCLLRADGRRLKQALMNVIANAIKVTPEGGQVAIRFETDHRGRPVFIVSDGGPALDPAAIDHVLRPFEAPGDVYVRPPSGSGLALPLAQRILRLHGGELEVHGGEGARGSDVRLILPSDRVKAG